MRYWVVSGKLGGKILVHWSSGQWFESTFSLTVTLNEESCELSVISGVGIRRAVALRGRTWTLLDKQNASQCQSKHKKLTYSPDATGIWNLGARRNHKGFGSIVLEDNHPRDWRMPWDDDKNNDGYHISWLWRLNRWEWLIKQILKVIKNHYRVCDNQICYGRKNHYKSDTISYHLT